MAVLSELDQDAWGEWLAPRPKIIRELGERLPPNRLYRLKGTGQRVTMYSYSEDGTVTVAITGEYNLIDFGRRVFGINPDDLEECDLPAPDEPLGEICQTREAVDMVISAAIAELHERGKQHNTAQCPLCDMEKRQ